MMRLVGWLCVAVLAIGAHVYDSDLLRGATAFAAIALIAWFAPAPLRLALCALAVAAVFIVVVMGTKALLESVPALIVAFVGFVFARTLLPRRTPLIARAIVLIDGPEWLAQPHVARYARRLTVLWSTYQFALAAAALVAIFHWPHWPEPSAFAVIVPLAVAALFVVEFALRPFLLPDVPRHGLLSFARRLILAWPLLLDDTAIDDPRALHR